MKIWYKDLKRVQVSVLIILPDLSMQKTVSNEQCVKRVKVVLNADRRLTLGEICPPVGIWNCTKSVKRTLKVSL